MDTTLKAIPENKEPTGPAKPQTIPVVEPKRLNCRNNQTAVQFPNKPSTKASPLKNTSSASPGELEATKRTSWRLSQRSLFTKQPKGMTNVQQEQLTRRFSELSDNVLKVIRTPSPFTRQSLETLLSQQLTKCLGPVVSHPSVTPVFIRATRDLLVSLVTEYEEREVTAVLVPEDNTSEGTSFGAESANTLSYRDQYLKELVVNVLQGLCGHKPEESRNLKILSEASKEQIREIRKLVKADSGINPETLEKLERRLDDLRKTLSLKHLESKMDQHIQIPKPAQQALRASCAKICDMENRLLEVSRRVSRTCLIGQTLKYGSEKVEQDKELEIFEKVNLGCEQRCPQNVNLDGAIIYSRLNDLSASFESSFGDDKSGFGDSDDEITQDEAKLYIEALIADRKRKNPLRSAKTLEVISEEEEVIINDVSLDSNSKTIYNEHDHICDKIHLYKFNLSRESSVEFNLTIEDNHKSKNLQQVCYKNVFDSKLEHKTSTEENQVDHKQPDKKLKHTCSIPNLVEVVQFNPGADEVVFSSKFNHERAAVSKKMQVDEFQCDFKHKKPVELDKLVEEIKTLQNSQQILSNVCLQDSQFVCDISKEMRLVHRQVQMSPSSTSNILNINEKANSNQELDETNSSGQKNRIGVEFSINEVGRILFNISERIKDLPDYLNNVGVTSHQRKILITLFDPYLSYNSKTNAMSTTFTERMSKIYFRLSEILNRTPQKLKEEPISALNPPHTLIKTLATLATTDFFKDCFVSSIIESKEEMENITFYDAVDQCDAIVNCKHETKSHELTSKIKSQILPDVASSLALRYAIQKNLTLQEVSTSDFTYCNRFLEVSPDSLTLQNVSDMFLFFSTVLNDVPDRIKSREILSLNPPASLLNALNILYAADSPCDPNELTVKNSFDSLKLQDAANFFLILSSTLEKTPQRLRSSSISALNPPESFLKAVSLLTSLAHSSALASESQDEVDSQSSQDYFDAMDYVELLECA